MRRYIGAVLALAVALAQFPAPAALASADLPETVIVQAEEEAREAEVSEEELVAEIVEAPEDEPSEGPAPAEDTGSAGLVMDEGALTVDDVAEELPEMNETADDEQGAVLCRYARVAAESARVFPEAEAADPVAELAEGAVVLLAGEAQGQRQPVAMLTERGVVTAWMDAEALAELTEAEAADYQNQAATNPDAAVYNDNPDALLAPVACSFIQTEAPSAEEADPQTGDGEENPQAGEGTEEPQTTDGEGGQQTDAQTPAGNDNSEENKEETSENEEQTQSDAALATDEGNTDNNQENQDGLDTRATLSLARNDIQLPLGGRYAIQAYDESGFPLMNSFVEFDSGDEQVALVSADGVVTANSVGETEITVSYANYQPGVMKVQVLALPTGVSASPTKRTVGVGEVYTGLRAVFPAGTQGTPTFSTTSAGKKIISVNASTGAITGKKAGTATVTISVKGVGGKTFKATCKVTVKNAPKKVTLNAKSITLGEPVNGVGGSYLLKASVPSKTTGGVLLWTSSDPSVATVSGGLVRAVSPGKATITVKTYNGVGKYVRSAACAVTVTAAPATAAYTATSVMCVLNKTVTPGVSILDATGAPAAGHPVFRLESASPKGCVSLNAATGKVKGLKKGTAVISFTTYNGVPSENKVTITVKPAVKKIKLSAKSLPTTKCLAVGQEFSNWKVSVSPSGAYNNFTFSSSNKKVIQVIDAKKGVIKGIKPGSAYIRVKAHNGKSSKVKVVVKKAPTKVTMSPASAVLKVGKSGKYKVSLHGAGGSYSFASSNPEVATVNGSGKVVAKAEGVTTITVSAVNYVNGKTYSAKSTLTVKKVIVPGLPTSLYSNATSAGDGGSQQIEYAIYLAQTKAGCKYVYGGGYTRDNPSTFDCAGLTYWAFWKAGVKMGSGWDSAYKQGYDNRYEKISYANLRRGDVVCFNTNTKDGDLSDHTGIYLGNGYFIHASSGKGKVIVSNLNSGYYSNKRYKSSSGWTTGKFSWGRRVIG